MLHVCKTLRSNKQTDRQISAKTLSLDYRKKSLAIQVRIARFRDISLIKTFCLLCRKTVDTVNWQVAKKIVVLSFYTKMSRRWLISSLKLKGFYQHDFLIINTELKRMDGIFMYFRFPEDRDAEFFCQLSFSNPEIKWPKAHGPVGHVTHRSCDTAHSETVFLVLYFTCWSK